MQENEIINQGLRKRPLELYKTRDYLAVYASEEEIMSIKPDFELLKKLDCLGIIISAPGDEADFVSRFFAPSVGINEDPVTGSAHSTLVPYWARAIKERHPARLSIVPAAAEEPFCRNSARGWRSAEGGPFLKGTITI